MSQARASARLASSGFSSGGAVAVALASVVALDPAGWFPFSIAKWAAVLTIGLLAIAVTLWESNVRIDSTSSLLWAVLILLMIASAIAGVGGIETWFGTPIRHLGVIAWVLFALLFVLGQHIGSTQLFIRGLVVVGAALGGYALVELLFGAPVDYLAITSRLGGPYGSAAYLGAACCLLLPVAVGVAAEQAEPLWWRWFAGWVGVSLFAALLGSGARAALVGVAVACVVTAVVRLHFRRDVATRWSGAATAAVVAAAAALAVGAVSAATSVFERSAGVSSRIDEWRVGIRAAADRPIVGTGPEGYRLVVDRYLDADYVRTYGDSVLPDRAHNSVLDVAIFSGVPAAIVYLILLALMIWAAVRLIRGGSTTDVGVGTAVVAFVVQQQFLFPIAEIDPVFWILCGSTLVRADRLTNTPRAHYTIDQRPLRLVAATAFLVAAVVAGVFGVRNVAADRLSLRAIEGVESTAALTDATSAVELAPADVRHRVVLARTQEQVATLTATQQALTTIEDALDVAPLDPTLVRERARLTSLLASITGLDGDWAAATARWEEMIKAAPNCASCHRGLGLTLLDSGNLNAARPSLTVAADLGDSQAQALLIRLPDD